MSNMGNNKITSNETTYDILKLNLKYKQEFNDIKNIYFWVSNRELPLVLAMNT